MFADIVYAMAPGSGEGGQGGITPLITMAAVFFIFYLLLIRPQQKRLKEHKVFLDNINKGDEVITNGGMLGKVVGITDKVLTIEIGENMRIKVLKSSISGSQKSLKDTRQ
jgi:preprotein translocase subunit YajC